MEIVNIKSTSFPDAHELPNRGGRPVSGKHKSPANNSGGKKGTDRPLAPPAQRKRDQDQTAANRRMLIIGPDGKRHWARTENADARLAEIKRLARERELSRSE